MVFVIIDSANNMRVTLVKAQDETELLDRLKLLDSQSVVGMFTDSMIEALTISAFIVIQT